MNLIILSLTYFTIVTSLIGYAYCFEKYIGKKIKLEYEFNLLSVILFWIVISFFSHFFFSHNYIHNAIIIIIGNLLFFYAIISKNKLFKYYSKYIALIFIILFLGLLIFKTHDDFPYYHFPYTYYLTQEKLVIGIGSLNHGFRTPSSIFYLNSIFYLPYIKYFSFNIGAVLLFGVSNLILIFRLRNDIKNQKYDFLFFLTLLSFLFINIFFYRISEHGTDRSAQILVLILFIEIFALLRKRISLNNFFSKIFILIGLIISLKAFYVLYLLVFIPILFFFREKKIVDLFLSFFKNFYFHLFFLIGIFLILINFFNTGCLLYPVEFTCFENLSWSLKHEAQQMNDWYEQWSKAGAGPDYRVLNPDIYIQNFNWVNNWVDKYFFNKVSDFLLGIFFLVIVVFFTFFSQKIKKIKIDKKFFWIFVILILLLSEWFFNHPSLRYGGYSLIALIIFIPSSIYISKFIIKNNIKKKMITLITISLIIFIGRNINRINNEIKSYNYDILNEPYYLVEKDYFRIEQQMNRIKENYSNCKNENFTNCNQEKIMMEKENNYFVLTIKK